MLKKPKETNMPIPRNKVFPDQNGRLSCLVKMVRAIRSPLPRAAVFGINKRMAMATLRLMSLTKLFSGLFEYQALAWPSRIRSTDVERAIIVEMLAILGLIFLCEIFCFCFTAPW